MNAPDIEPHQIYILQVMAQPADIQIDEYDWDSDEVPVAIANFWMIAFTDWYRGQGKQLLPNLADDIIAIDSKRHDASENGPDGIWTNDGLRNDPFWEDMRNLAKAALKHRGIQLLKPDPAGWYDVLPEELH